MIHLFLGALLCTTTYEAAGSERDREWLGVGGCCWLLPEQKITGWYDDAGDRDLKALTYDDYGAQ